MKFLQILILLLCLSTQIYAQSEGEQVIIITNEGIKISGEVVTEDSASITINTSYGETKINRENIADIRFPKKRAKHTEAKDEGRNEVNDDGRDDSYSSSHYLFSQSGYNLNKGQSYYENIYLFLNSYTIGVTNNFQVTVGAEIATLLFAREFPAIFITPKISFPFKFGSVSAGTTLLRIPASDVTVGFLQGALTLGSRRKNFTIGTGAGFGTEDGINRGFIPIILSGMTDITNNISLVSENWLIKGESDNFGVLSFGVRFHSRNKNNFLTAALFRTTEDQGPLLAFPFISGQITIR